MRAYGKPGTDKSGDGFPWRHHKASRARVRRQVAMDMAADWVGSPLTFPRARGLVEALERLGLW